MRPAPAPYPVDRYLVESRKQFDMVNIIDDDIWNPGPTLRPEDEILLRKLHDMLQTTADDLKLLSGELSKYHEPGVQVKTLPMPLDEEFNEKVHIEEVVNAKFYGNKIVNRTQPSPAVAHKTTVESTLRSINDMINKKNATQSGKTRDLSMDIQPIKKKLQISRTHIMEIKDKSGNEEQTEKHVTLNNAQENKRDASPAVAYNEFSHKYIQPNVKKTPQKSLQIQEMPSIDIRSELRLQNVLQLDILPEILETHTQQPVQQNALVIEMQYEAPIKRDDPKTIKFENSQYIPKAAINRPTTRKVSTMTAYETSESNNTSSDSQHRLQRQLRNIPTTLKTSTLKQKVVSNTQKNNTVTKGTTRPQAYLEEWKRKLNTVYISNSKNSAVKKKKVSYKNTSNKTAMNVKTKEDKKCVKSQPKSDMNTTEYIPYSKFTLGGVNVSDIEREISNIPNRNNIVLSPILDKILSSRENSFHNESPKKNSQSKNPKILTTSDENLLQEVLDIEMKVAKTLNIDKNTNKYAEKIENNINDSTKDDSYADDFEDEKSDASKPIKSETSKSSHNIPSDNSCQEESDRMIVTEEKNKINKGSKSDSNLTFTKAPSLSFKNKVDIFEFIHSVDTQETGTQSNTSNKITPKETQTSPRCDNANVQPIHNDLWPSIDPRGEVEKMLKLEKELIKKLIIDEYGDLLEKSLTKPSTSGKTENSEVNVAASQKITQTSPAHVKSVMTSPTRTKTRTTSPFALSVAVYQQTSPIVPVSNEELKIELDDDDLGISANLSSPRFSLRLPQTSREVFSKLETKVQNNKKTAKLDYLRKNVFSSSSSVDGDYSSSDISSLGELNKKFKRLKKSRIPSISEISSSSSLSKYSSDPSGAILPLRSEGEASIGQMNRRKTNKHSKSEGEVSLGQLR